MGRKAVDVNLTLLKNIINEAELKQTFNNHSHLFEFVANAYNEIAKPKKRLSPSVVYLRVKDLNLDLKTKKGEKGSGLSCGINRKRKSRKEKINGFDFSELKKVAPKEFHPMIDKYAETGSLPLGIKINCIHCSGWQRSEVGKCLVRKCIFYPTRPYQKDLKDDE